jgi:predicted neuraminidase
MREGIQRELIPTFDRYRSCHASTIALAGDRVLVAYFAGPYEGHRRTGIWTSIKDRDQWGEPREICSGKRVVGIERPCWNPVLMQFTERLFLFFKVGKSPETWRGYFMTSRDRGDSWSDPQALPAGIIGPTKNSPILVGNQIVSPSSDERGGCSIHFELSHDGVHWRRNVLEQHGVYDGCIQPAVLHLGGRCLIAYARTAEGYIAKTKSDDGGNSWSGLELTGIPNPDSAISAISLAPDLHVLLYNRSPTERTPLVLATSLDGYLWNDRLVLEDGPGEFSYPSLARSAKGVGISYTHNRTSIAYAHATFAELTD